MLQRPSLPLFYPSRCGQLRSRLHVMRTYRRTVLESCAGESVQEWCLRCIVGRVEGVHLWVFDAKRTRLNRVSLAQIGTVRFF